MAETDPVVVRLIVENGTFLADINNSARVVDRQFGHMEGSALSLERQMRSSLSSMSAAFKSAASTFAVGFSIGQVGQLADTFTRIQNSLKVAGLEGENLERVQASLLDQSGRYGVSLESLADLFGNASQAGKELGASQSDIIDVTEAVSQALLITGKNSVEASGAILGLTQAFNKGKLQAEEWGQINEGGLRPLLQAAAASEKYGGSIAKLQAAAYDGKVSSKEFFDAILAGSKVLDGQASKASLTLSGALEALNSRIVVYVGQTDKALGASERVAEGIRLLADNIDPLVTALSVVATFLGTRYVASMGLAAGATLAKVAADVRATQSATALAAMQARLNPFLLGTAASANVAAAGVTRLAVAGGVAARGFGVLVAALGGPVVIALAALAAGIAYATLRQREALQPTKAYADAQRDAASSADATAKSLDKLAFAHGKEREQMLAAMRVRREAIKEKLNEARANLALAKTELESAQSAFQLAAERDRVAAKDPRLATGIDKPGAATRLDQAAVNVNAQSKALDQRAKELDAITAGINAPAYTPPSAQVDDDKKKKKARSGPTAEEITTRYNDDLSRLKAEQLQAELQVTTDAQKRADLQTELLDIEYKQRLADINASKEYSEERKDALRKELNALFGMDEKGSTVAGPANVYSAVFKDLSDQQKQMAQDALASEREALEAEADLITNRKDRLAAEQAILGIVEQEERQRLELQIANGQILDAAKARAELERRLAARREGLDRQYESPLEQRRREVRQTAANMGDAIEQIDIDAVDRLADGLANASTEYIKLGGIAGDVINGIIQDLVRLAAKQALFGNNGGAGIIGSIGSFLGLGGSSSVGGISAEAQSWLDNYTPKGFATGGYTGDGPRNEVAGVVHRGEYVIPANAVDRIGIQNLAALTSGDTSAARAMTGVTAAGMGARPVQQTVVVKVEANDYFDARVDQRATQVAAPIGVAASAQARNAAGSDATRAARRRIPGR